MAWLTGMDLRKIEKYDIEQIHELDTKDLHELRQHEDFKSTGIDFLHLLHMKHLAHVHVENSRAARGDRNDNVIIDDRGLEKVQKSMNAELDRAQR